MSSRALRRLKGEQRAQAALHALKLTEEDDKDEDEQMKTNTQAAHKQKNISNIFELIGEADVDVCPSDEEPAEGINDRQQGAPMGKDAVKNEKSKKKKKKKSPAENGKDNLGAGDNIDAILETLEKSKGLSRQSTDNSASEHRPVLYVEHRNLNPETELKKYFGARAVLGDQRKKQRQRQFHRCSWMTVYKDTWPRFSRPGISMSLVESKDGIQHFTFEHNRDYQQVQFKFFDAVESMDPNNIVVLLQLNPYHIDSLLQLSDVCRIQEDQETARDLIERALYSFECSFHPVFSLTSGMCRLDYHRPENRAFYLVLFKHVIFLEKRGCPRTALEYCKLILSLDPDNDPLCMLLLFDFLCLRCREYTTLIRLYEEWEVHRNLSQLPNFSFSVALSYYHLSQQEDISPVENQQLKQKSNVLLQNALIMFPGALMPLLDLCTVQPDAAVSSHAFFGPSIQTGQPPALSELVSLYVGRCHSLWKEAGQMLWLEENVRKVLKRVDTLDPYVEDCQNKRKQRYQSAPRNIHRHVLMSEIKEATATLPLEVTTQPGMGFDPLPPLDSILSYTRPERQNMGASNESTLSLFFRSLLPNFNLQVSECATVCPSTIYFCLEFSGGVLCTLSQNIVTKVYKH
ncbi:transcription factor 25 [Rhinichthys klamathensis goyatoka]|uniref:transcription factor 25 n=1 Tax=Rhinichthys klamathensis goyatoka TaxID=3034132 RepID=UPI0024B4911A|nr:transcription factor 25 [Rhinichthys klamathensis goyatoka]